MNAGKSEKKRRLALGVLAIFVAALIVQLLLSIRRKPEDKPPPDLLRALLKLRQELEWPGLDAAGAARNLATKEGALDFVRNGVLYVPYRGVWGGAEGTLRTRIGNCADKSVLLGALLRELGFQVRFFWSSYYPGKSQPYVGKDIHTEFPALDEVRHILDLPHAGGAGASSPTDQARQAIFNEMRKEIDSSLQVIRGLVKKSRVNIGLDGQASAGERNEVAPVGERYWVWLEARRGRSRKWEVLDPVFPEVERPSICYEFTPAPAAFSVDLAAVDSDGREESIVGWSGPAAEVLGHEISLHFLPAKGTLRMLGQITDPAKVRLWNAVLQLGPACRRGGAFTPDGLVLHMHDGEVRVGAGTAVAMTKESGLRIEAVPIKSLSVRSVDSWDYPRVRVHLAMETEKKPYWHHRHFRVAPVEDPARSFPVRIESASAAARPIVLVVDASVSMFEKHEGEEHTRIELARQGVRELLDELRSDQTLSLVSFAGNVVVHTEPAPLSQVKDRLLSTIDQLSQRWYTRIPDAVSAVLRQSDKPSYVVFLTDGQDNRKGDWSDGREYERLLAEAGEALGRSQHRFIPVGIGDADHELLAGLARISGTKYHKVIRPEDLPAIYGSIGAELSGRAVISFVAASESDDAPGRNKRVSIRVEGYPRPLEAQYTIPAPPKAPPVPRHLRLTVKLTGGGCPARTFSRVIADLSKGADPWALMASHRIGFAVAAVPSRVVLARYVDEMIEACRLRGAASGGSRPTQFSSRRGLSWQTAGVINSTLAALGKLTPETVKLGWRGPTLFIQSVQLANRPEAPALRRTLDFLHHSFGPAWDSRRIDRVAWGLALAAVEGRLLQAGSVNTHLLAQADYLHVVRTPADLPARRTPGRGILDKVFAEGGFVIRSTKVPGCVWAISPSGRLQAVLHRQRQAKGASVEETAAGYKRIRNVLRILAALASGAFSAMENPNGALLAALCNFYDEEMKLWCFSSVMLGLVSEGIEQGKFDPEQAKARAKKLCELEGDPDDFRINLGAAFVAGWAGGMAENQFASLVNPASRAGRFFVSSAASYFDPISRGGRDFMIRLRNEITSGR